MSKYKFVKNKTPHPDEARGGVDELRRWSERDGLRSGLGILRPFVEDGHDQDLLAPSFCAAHIHCSYCVIDYSDPRVPREPFAYFVSDLICVWTGVVSWSEELKSFEVGHLKSDMSEPPVSCSAKSYRFLHLKVTIVNLLLPTLNNSLVVGWSLLFSLRSSFCKKCYCFIERDFFRFFIFGNGCVDRAVFDVRTVFTVVKRDWLSIIRMVANGF